MYATRASLRAMDAFFLRRMERRQPFTDCDVIYRGERGFSSLPVCGCAEQGNRKIAEGRLVIAQGMLAEISLVAQVLEKLGNSCSI